MATTKEKDTVKELINGPAEETPNPQAELDRLFKKLQVYRQLRNRTTYQKKQGFIDKSIMEIEDAILGVQNGFDILDEVKTEIKNSK